MNRQKFAYKLDMFIYCILIIFAATFYLDLPVNFITVAFILSFIKYLLVRTKIKLHSKHLWVIILFLLTILIAACFNTGGQPLMQGLSAYKTMFINPLAGLFIAFFWNFNQKSILIILSCFAFSLTLNALVAIGQFCTSTGTDRIIGLFSDKMLLAAVHMILLPIFLTIVVYIEKLPKLLKYFYIFMLIVNIPAVILSGTRIVWIGLFISSLLILLSGIKNKAKSLCFILLIIIISGTTIYLNPALHDRLHSIDNVSTSEYAGYQSNRERLLMWHAAWQMFKNHAVFGVGPGNFYEQYREIYRIPTAKEYNPHAHNVLLNTMAESGSIGTVGLIVLFGYLYYDVIKKMKTGKNIAATVYFFSLVTFNINFLTDVLFCGHVIKLPTYIFWLITGMYLSLSGCITMNDKDIYNKDQTNHI